MSVIYILMTLYFCDKDCDINHIEKESHAKPGKDNIEKSH